MAEIDARPLIDKQGNQFFPYTDISCVNGLPDNLEDLDSNDVLIDISDIKNQLANLPPFPTITDTGWKNISLSSGITEYSSTWTPKYRLITINGVSFLSLKGAVKGLTGATTIGTLPNDVTPKIISTLPYVQTMSAINNTPQFNKLSVQTNGNILLEYSTTSISSNQWLPIGTTLML